MRSSEMSESQLRAAVNQLVDDGTVTEAQIEEAFNAKFEAAMQLAAELGLTIGGAKVSVITSAAAGTARPRTTKSSTRPKAAASGNGNGNSGKTAAPRKSRPSAAVTAARKLQGQYMGLIRNVTGKDKERFKAVAAEKGKAVAIFQLRRYHAERA